MKEYTDFLFEIVICFLLSSCIGIERQYRRRSVGLRTIILVSLGSFLFVRFSFAFEGSDMTRIAAQVVAGIGFLGAGVIIKDNKSVKGLTTAATLWCAAAIGILCSASLLFEAAVGTLLILFTNIILRTLNSKINNLTGNLDYKVYLFKIVCEEQIENDIFKEMKRLAQKNNTMIKSMTSTETEDGNVKMNIEMIVADNKDTIVETVMQKFSGRKDVISISLNKSDTRFIDENEEL